MVRILMDYRLEWRAEKPIKAFNYFVYTFRRARVMKKNLDGIDTLVAFLYGIKNQSKQWSIVIKNTCILVNSDSSKNISRKVSYRFLLSVDSGIL